MDINTAYSEKNREYMRSLFAGIDRNTSEALSRMMRDNVDVKRGLRNADGTGVMIGYTKVGNVLGYSILDGERIPMEGHLSYAGYEVSELVEGYRKENRFGFEETAFLLLLGRLPNAEELDMFQNFLYDNMAPARQLHRGHDPQASLPGHHEPAGPLGTGPLLLGPQPR